MRLSITVFSSKCSKVSKLASNLCIGIFYLLLFTFSISVYSQELTTTEKFKKTLLERSEKIVKALNISNNKKKDKVVAILVNQYIALNQIHDSFKAKVSQVKLTNVEYATKEATIAEATTQKENALRKLHQSFLKKLSKKISDNQIEKIKDGMTYSVMQITYAAYQDEVLSLTAEQKKKIYDWLYEARELAMDEGSSDDKHKMFGKYKGKINNYLSQQGYDMKAEEKGWQQRIKEKKSQNKN